MSTTEGRLTVLLAEDDENDVILLGRALAKLGTVEQIRRVSDGDQARAYLKRDPPYSDRTEHPFPDVLILDQHLPRVTGLEVLQWLRRRARFDRLPVVVCSVFEPSQTVVIKRLNAACCEKTGDIHEMARSLGEAMVSAFRMASVIPEVTWYRSIGARPRSGPIPTEIAGMRH